MKMRSDIAMKAQQKAQKKENIVGGLSVLELLCRLLGQLGSRLYDRLVTGGNGILYRTTPPRTESPLSVDGAAIAASGDMSG